MLTLMCLKRVTILWVTEGMGEEDRVPKTPGEDVQGPAGPSPCGGGSQSDRNPDQAQALGAAGCGGVWMAARRARWAPGPVPEEVEVASLGWEQLPKPASLRSGADSDVGKKEMALPSERAETTTSYNIPPPPDPAKQGS